MRTSLLRSPFCIVLGLAVVMTSACSSNANSTVSNYLKNKQSLCTPWAKISLGDYEINNNVWGKGNILDYSQCVFGKLNSQSGLPGEVSWAWRWPDTEDGVKAYPSILFGRKPWHDYSTTSWLPQKIDKLKQLTVSYKLETRSRGSMNLLLESWITRTDKATPVDRVGELAIHLYQKNWPGQAGSYVDSVVINGIDFDLYINKKMRVPGDSHTWVYYGFVHKGKSVSQAKLDIMKFARYLVGHGYVDRKHYIASVELGNEIDHGQGKTELEYFSVQAGN